MRFLFHKINILIDWCIYEQKLFAILITQKWKTKYENISMKYQRGNVLNDDIWQDLTEHESKFEFVDEEVVASNRKTKQREA